MSVCPSCSAPRADGDAFCGSCGAALRSSDHTATPGRSGTFAAPAAVPAGDAQPIPPVTAPASGEPPRELRILGYATIAAAAVAATCIIPGTLALRYSGEVDLASRQSISDLSGVSSLLYVGGFLIGAILFIILTYKLRTNLDRLNVSGLRYGADQAIWPWFIPFFNLVRPVQFVRDLARGLHGRGERPGRLPYQTGTAVPAPGVITLWWILSILAGLLTRADMTRADMTSAAGVFISAWWLPRASWADMTSAAGVFISSLAACAAGVATGLVVYTLLKLNRRAVAAFNAEQPDASA